MDTWDIDQTIFKTSNPVVAVDKAWQLSNNY